MSQSIEDVKIIAVNLPQTSAGTSEVTYARLRNAAKVAMEKKDITPLLKEELRLKIKAKRHASGQEDIRVEFTPPQKHELTPEELERKERRRLQNRLAARRCRKKKKMTQTVSKEEFDKQVRLQAALEREMSRLRDERDRLKQLLEQHLSSGFCGHIKTEPSETACNAEIYNMASADTGRQTTLLIKSEDGVQSATNFCLNTVNENCFDQTAPPSPFNSHLGSGYPLHDSFPAVHSAYTHLTEPGADNWGRGYPSTSGDSDVFSGDELPYTRFADTPEASSPCSDVYSPQDDLPLSQRSTGFEVTANRSPGSPSPGVLLLPTPDASRISVGGSTSDLSFYPGTPEAVCQNSDLPTDPDCDFELMNVLTSITNNAEEMDDDVFELDDESLTLNGQNFLQYLNNLDNY